MTDFDVAIVGAGPAGMSAACYLAECGFQVVVLDECAAPGGQVFRSAEQVRSGRPADLKALGRHYRSGLRLIDRFRDSGVIYRPRTAVWQVSAIEEPALTIGTVSDKQAGMIQVRHIVLAAGAMERPTPFPGWTLPGVMTVGAAQTLLKSSGLVPEGRIALAGSGPLLYLYASQLIAAGKLPDIILDTRPRASWRAKAAALPALAADPRSMVRGLGWMREVRGQVPVREMTRCLRATGDDRLTSISFESHGHQFNHQTDLLLVHDGVIPNTWLAMSAGCRHHWDERQRCWAPDINGAGQTSRPSISIVGDAAGIVGADACVLHGEAVAREVAGCLADHTPVIADDGSRSLSLWRHRSLRRFLDLFYPPSGEFELPPEDDTVVCRCEEVTAGEIRRVAALGCVGPNQGKAFTRCGMGPCMGRKCGVTVSRLIAEHHGLAMDEVGHYRIRPPVKPITVGQLADLNPDATE